MKKKLKTEISEDEKILLELKNAPDRVSARKVRKKYKNSRISAKQSIKLLLSLEQLSLFAFILIFVFYLFFGYVSTSRKIVYMLYNISFFCVVFIVIFGIVGIIYSVYKSYKSKVYSFWFIFTIVARILFAISLFVIQSVLKLVSNGGLFNV